MAYLKELFQAALKGGPGDHVATFLIALVLIWEFGLRGIVITACALIVGAIVNVRHPGT